MSHLVDLGTLPNKLISLVIGSLSIILAHHDVAESVLLNPLCNQYRIIHLYKIVIHKHNNIDELRPFNLSHRVNRILLIVLFCDNADLSVALTICKIVLFLCPPNNPSGRSIAITISRILSLHPCQASIEYFHLRAGPASPDILLAL